MASRPLVTVQSPNAQKVSTVPLPHVMTAPIRPDLVRDVHKNMNKNHRQPYAVYHFAGAQTSAISWGTGRAVSRIPRVKGGGTHRSGQGAFGNMCRGGRMFSPTRIWRKWHVKTNKAQRRYAVCSALSASSVAPLVTARGHRIHKLAEIPLVVADVEVDTLTKTKEAIALLKSLGVMPDIERVQDSRHIRPGKGKARNRRYVQRRGPLMIHDKELGSSMLVPAFRNVPGMDFCNVNRLNLLQLAPGGHVGRLLIFTESAFKQLDRVYGSKTEKSEVKAGFTVPRGIVTNSDIGRIINSEEIQSVLRPRKRREFYKRKRNPLKHFQTMVKLNPFELTRKRRAIEAAKNGKQQRKEIFKASRVFVEQNYAPAIAPERGPDEILPV